MEDEVNEKILGLPLGGWIQWILGAFVTFAVTYVTIQITPIRDRLEHLEDYKFNDRLSHVENEHRHMAKEIEDIKDEMDDRHEAFARTYKRIDSAQSDHELLKTLIRQKDNHRHITP